jgi:hypothetical protein
LFEVGDLVKYRKDYLDNLDWEVGEVLYNNVWEVTRVRHNIIDGKLIPYGNNMYLGGMRNFELVADDSGTLEDWI